MTSLVLVRSTSASADFWGKSLFYIFILFNILYRQTCPMWPSKETVKYGHTRQINTSLNEMKCTVNGNKESRPHNTRYCLIEVVTKPGLTVVLMCNKTVSNKSKYSHLAQYD